LKTEQKKTKRTSTNHLRKTMTRVNFFFSIFLNRSSHKIEKE